MGGLGLCPGGKLQYGPLGTALLTFGVKSLLISWHRNALRIVGISGVLPLISLVVSIWGGMMPCVVYQCRRLVDVEVDLLKLRGTSCLGTR